MSTDFEALVDQAQEDAYKPVKQSDVSQARKISRLLSQADKPLEYDVRQRPDGIYQVVNTRTYQVFAPYTDLEEARDVARELNADSKK